MNVVDTLGERGFLKQTTDEKAIRSDFDKGRVTVYCGVDPTASSLHVGHLVPYMALRHIQQAGHRVVVIVGGGTARIGDPSGKTETRKMLSVENIKENTVALSRQLERFLVLDGEKGILVDNANWLASLNYLDFLRDIGSHFSVNRMLSFEAYKMRMETGLSFLEFNYQLLQSYDYLQLFDQFHCTLQIGGDDQWGNIVAGADLIRRLRSAEVQGMTVPLITRSDGKKMGKTEKGSLFLDPSLTSPFDFYQYWRNISDDDVEHFLKIFTMMSLEEIVELTRYKDERINQAKEILAFEFTKTVHGDAEAQACRQAAKGAFSGDGDLSALPKVNISREDWEKGIPVLDLYTNSGLVQSKSEARRLIQQNGASINENPLTVETQLVGSILNLKPPYLLKAGKKRVAVLEVL